LIHPRREQGFDSPWGRQIRAQMSHLHSDWPTQPHITTLLPPLIAAGANIATCTQHPSWSRSVATLVRTRFARMSLRHFGSATPPNAASVLAQCGPYPQACVAPWRARHGNGSACDPARRRPHRAAHRACAGRHTFACFASSRTSPRRHTGACAYRVGKVSHLLHSRQMLRTRTITCGASEVRLRAHRGLGPSGKRVMRQRGSVACVGKRYPTAPCVSAARWVGRMRLNHCAGGGGGGAAGSRQILPPAASV